MSVEWLKNSKEHNRTKQNTTPQNYISALKTGYLLRRGVSHSIRKNRRANYMILQLNTAQLIPFAERITTNQICLIDSRNCQNIISELYIEQHKTVKYSSFYYSFYCQLSVSGIYAEI